MESDASWDSLTATLAVVDLRDLEAVWGFLIHTGVIEHTTRGAFDRVVSAVTEEVERGPITGGSCASRVANRLRGLQTPRGARLDPGGAAARQEHAVWLAGRPAHKSR